MPRNYDTTNQKPFPRTSQLSITYPTTGMPVLTYIERDAIVDAAKQVHFLATGERQCNVDIDLAKRDEQIPLVNPATGEIIPNQYTSVRHMIMCLTAIIRADQMRRDGPHANDPSEGV